MTDSITIRPLRNEEKPALAKVMRRSFPLIQQWFFAWTENVLVGEYRGEPLGAIVLEVFPLPKGRKAGFVAWVFTDPRARGLGMGQQLTEAALAFFEAQECDEILACVEGYNASSSKLWATRGFDILSPGEQVRRYGMGIIPVWIHAFHFLDIGHFLWARPGADVPDHPGSQWLGTLAANMLIMGLVMGRQLGFGQLGLLETLWAISVVAALLALRTLAMWLTAKAQRLTVRFRAWESGFPVSLLVAAVFGSWFPVPGSLYPTTHDWRYRDLLPKLGPMALAGLSTTLIGAGVTRIALHLEWGTGALEPLLRATYNAGIPLALFDILMAFFPFASFNGRRVWDWNRVIWMGLAFAVLALILL
ncbi:MAG: GNAT family N-acetyltransferase [Anaerolineae bacterium]|nr:GNAT family N-acetyltransferase [Anaerolineae bacterium]